jgi:signal transduction histidine kinase
MHPGSGVAANHWQDLRKEHLKEATHANAARTRSGPEVELEPMTQMTLERPARLEAVPLLAAERQRIAEELQGRTIHRLFAIGLKLQAMSSDREDAEISNRVDACVNELDVTITDLRALIFNLGHRSV